jgi:hypothetical protein
MPDDIVTQLRALISDLRKTVPQTLMIEAADEIERLRKEYEHCRLQMLVYQRIAELGPQAVREGI